MKKQETDFKHTNSMNCPEVTKVVQIKEIEEQVQTRRH